MKLEDAVDNPKTKMIIDFDCESVTSSKPLAVTKNSKIKITSRFFNGKMLMFAKLYLMSFI